MLTALTEAQVQGQTVVIGLGLVLFIAFLIILWDAQEKRWARRKAMGLPLQGKERVGIDHYSLRSWPRRDDLNGVDDRHEHEPLTSREEDPYEQMREGLL